MTTDRSARPALSMVVPLYNEQEVFDRLVERLAATMTLAGDSAEAVLVDDGSSDRTPELIAAVCARDPRFVGVMLSRNFGHQLAVSAGLAHASGEAVAVLDGDLQDPPEIVLKFWSRLREGYDVVYAVRRKRKEGLIKRAAYASFYRILQWLSDIPIPLDSGDYGIMSRRVVEALNAMPERHRFVRGLRCYAGFRQVGMEYERDERAAGQPKYTLSKLLKLALDGIFTFSDRPLHFASFLGFAVAAISVVYGIVLVAWRVFSERQLPGFATVAAGMFFLGGVQLICVGILGEYIGRIHTEVKNRPPYLVARVVRGEL